MAAQSGALPSFARHEASARCFRSVDTTSSWPPEAATKSGVRSSLSRRSTTAPFLRRSTTMSWC
eukprot:2588693-Prorocentrum_lima.AAC.1